MALAPGNDHGDCLQAVVIVCWQDWQDQPGGAPLHPEGPLHYPPAHSPHLVGLQQQQQKHHVFRELSGDCSILGAGTPGFTPVPKTLKP
jgi:hypothetical protein